MPKLGREKRIYRMPRKHFLTDVWKIPLYIVLNRKNAKKNTSGVRGVTYDRATQKWQAQIVFKGKSNKLGRYISKENAIKARKMAEEAMFGNFLNGSRKLIRIERCSRSQISSIQSEAWFENAWRPVWFFISWIWKTSLYERHHKWLYRMERYTLARILRYENKRAYRFSDIQVRKNIDCVNVSCVDVHTTQ